jgi:hypothetical protein
LDTKQTIYANESACIGCPVSISYSNLPQEMVMVAHTIAAPIPQQIYPGIWDSTKAYHHTFSVDVLLNQTTLLMPVGNEDDHASIAQFDSITEF